MKRRVKITKVVKETKKIINDRYLFLAMLSPKRRVGERPWEIGVGERQMKGRHERRFRYTYRIEST